LLELEKKLQDGYDDIEGETKVPEELVKCLIDLWGRGGGGGLRCS